MSKIVTIPKDRNPFVVIINGVEYKYTAGETVEVPDSVADVIEKYENAKPKPNENPNPGTTPGGSCNLPSVTTRDNGKFLRVVNGAWGAVSVPDAEGGSF